MQITIEGTTKEIADLVSEVQNRLLRVREPHHNPYVKRKINRNGVTISGTSYINPEIMMRCGETVYYKIEDKTVKIFSLNRTCQKLEPIANFNLH